MVPDSAVRLLFLASKKFESGKAVRGAFLLTDINTKPIEFRCTNPIRPTPLQTMLYGETLEQHIMVELVGLPLVSSLKEHPHLILVQEKSFLGIRPKIEIPIILVSKEEEISLLPNVDENPGHLLNSNSGKFEPIVLIPNLKFAQDREKAKSLLAAIFDSYDLSEPFNRISVALEQVHSQKVGEDK